MSKYKLDDTMTIYLLRGKSKEWVKKHFMVITNNNEDKWLSFIRRYNSRVRKAVKRL